MWRNRVSDPRSSTKRTSDKFSSLLSTQNWYSSQLFFSFRSLNSSRERFPHFKVLPCFPLCFLHTHTRAHTCMYIIFHGCLRQVDQSEDFKAGFQIEFQTRRGLFGEEGMGAVVVAAGGNCFLWKVPHWNFLCRLGASIHLGSLSPRSSNGPLSFPYQ